MADIIENEELLKGEIKEAEPKCFISLCMDTGSVHWMCEEYRGVIWLIGMSEVAWTLTCSLL